MVVTTVVGTWFIKRYRDTYGYAVMLSILTALLLTNTVLAGRRVGFEGPFGWEMVLLSGTVIWPFTSQVVDMINEVYGAKKSYVAAGVAYIGRLIFLVVVVMAAQMSPVWEPAAEGWWSGYFGSVWRIVLAGAISYGAVQFFNIYVFAKFKRRTLPTEIDFWSRLKGGFLRSWGGDFFGDLLDGPIFYIIGFAGILPWPDVVTLTISATATKFFINQVDLPFYALFRVLLGSEIQKEY
jgi:hypothetical protein